MKGCGIFRWIKTEFPSSFLYIFYASLCCCSVSSAAVDIIMMVAGNMMLQHALEHNKFLCMISHIACDGWHLMCHMGRMRDVRRLKYAFTLLKLYTSP